MEDNRTNTVIGILVFYDGRTKDIKKMKVVDDGIVDLWTADGVRYRNIFRGLDGDGLFEIIGGDSRVKKDVSSQIDRIDFKFMTFNTFVCNNGKNRFVSLRDEE